MSKLLAMTVAVAVLATTANAAPFIGSTWNTSDDFSGTSAPTEKSSVIDAFFRLIGFDEEFAAKATLVTIPASGLIESSHDENKQCDNGPSDTTEASNIDETESEASGPEPILFAF